MGFSFQFIESGKTVLQSKSNKQLGQTNSTVYKALKAFLNAPDSFRMDSEFKANSQGNIIIKQARPLN